MQGRDPGQDGARRRDGGRDPRVAGLVAARWREQDARPADDRRLRPPHRPANRHARAGRHSGPDGRAGARMSERDVGIVGGGLLGVGVAYRLACAGDRVTLYERDDRLGGLAGTTDLGGYDVDRYYHAVLPTDDRVLALAEEVALGPDQVRMRRLGG